MASTKRIVKEYVNFDDYLKDALLGEAAARKQFYGSMFRWAGGRKLHEAIEFTKCGADEADTKIAKDLIEKIDASFRDRESQQWVPSVCGAYPIVPEFLMGLPQNMRQRMPVEDMRAPVKICVEVTVSAGCERNTIVERGAAVAALAMRMSEERPTELHLLYAMKDTAQDAQYGELMTLVRMSSSPLSLSHCVAVMADPSFCRMVQFAHMFGQTKSNGKTSIPWIGGVQTKERDKLIRSAFNLTPHDVIVEGGHLTYQNEIVRDSIKWVHDQLERQRCMDAMGE